VRVPEFLQSSDRPRVPAIRGRWPGQLFLELRRDPLAFLQEAQRTHGDAVRFRLGREQIYLLSHPDMVRDVLVIHAQSFRMALGFQRALLGEGLLTSDGALHQRQRRLIQPAFHHARIATYSKTMVEAALRAAERWVDGVELDVREELTRLNLELVAKTLFGCEVEGVAAEIGRAVTDVQGLFGGLAMSLGEVVLKFPLPSVRRFRRGLARLDLEVERIVAERRSDPSERGDLLSMLLGARDADGRPMSGRQLRDEVMTLFLTGHETITSALSWTLYLLGQNPEVERKLHAEVEEVFCRRAPKAEDLPRLQVARAVFSEALRLRPTAWAVARRALEPVKLGDGTVIPANALAVLSQWVVHHDARWFPEPERMVLERWTPEARAARHRFAYFPFGAGPRSCIGESFAWAAGTLVLAVIARRWRLVPVAGTTVRADVRITLRPIGLRMQVRSR